MLQGIIRGSYFVSIRAFYRSKMHIYEHAKGFESGIYCEFSILITSPYIQQLLNYSTWNNYQQLIFHIPP